MKKSAIEVVYYPILEKFETILAFSSTRTGGVSNGKYASLNLGLFSGDKPENIQENLNRFCQKIGISVNQLHLPFQTHENLVKKIDKPFLQLDKEVQTSVLHGFDALICDISGQCIGISTADCVPVLIFDPTKKAIAAIHAGWRGTCLRILKKTVEAMTENYGSNPADLVVSIGPSISPEVYEVGDELHTAFENEGFDTKQLFFRKNNRYHLDLWAANKLILSEIGVKTENIEILGLCSFTQQEKFFSARKCGIKSGRMISGIMIK